MPCATVGSSFCVSLMPCVGALLVFRAARGGELCQLPLRAPRYNKTGYASHM